MKVDTYDDDIALIGICVRHPYSHKKVLKWRNKYYELDEIEIHNWIETIEFYFIIEKSHAYNLKPLNK
jgi:hypothetical protein